MWPKLSSSRYPRAGFPPGLPLAAVYIGLPALNICPLIAQKGTQARFPVTDIPGDKRQQHTASHDTSSV